MVEIDRGKVPLNALGQVLAAFKASCRVLRRNERIARVRQNFAAVFFEQLQAAAVEHADETLENFRRSEVHLVGNKGITFLERFGQGAIVPLETVGQHAKRARQVFGQGILIKTKAHCGQAANLVDIIDERILTDAGITDEQQVLSLDQGVQNLRQILLGGFGEHELLVKNERLFSRGNICRLNTHSGYFRHNADSKQRIACK
jgi:hypothetical protein